MLNRPDRLEFCMAGLEKTFNVLECFPVIASFSGGTRCALGKLQVITGLALCALAAVACQLASTPAARRQCRLLFTYALDQATHGIANIVRGIAAAKLFIGPAAFFTYDLIGCRFRYLGELDSWDSTTGQRNWKNWTAAVTESLRFWCCRCP